MRVPANEKARVPYSSRAQVVTNRPAMLFAGFDFFCIPWPGEGDRSLGHAWLCHETGRQMILLNMDASNPRRFVQIALHEIAHHTCGHVAIATSRPAWAVEYQAEVTALRLLASLVEQGVFSPEDYEAAVLEAKRYIGRWLQPYIDDGIWHHVDTDVALWAGCALNPPPPPPRLAGVPPCGCRLGPDDEIPF